MPDRCGAAGDDQPIPVVAGVGSVDLDFWTLAVCVGAVVGSLGRPVDDGASRGDVGQSAVRGDAPPGVAAGGDIGWIGVGNIK